MVCRPCSEVLAGWWRAAVHGGMPAVAVIESRRCIGRREWPTGARSGDEVGWRVVVSAAAFVKLVRRLVFLKAGQV